MFQTIYRTVIISREGMMHPYSKTILVIFLLRESRSIGEARNTGYTKKKNQSKQKSTIVIRQAHIHSYFATFKKKGFF